MIHNPDLPAPWGCSSRSHGPTYEELMADQIAKAKSKKGDGDLQKLLDGDETWVIK